MHRDRGFTLIEVLVALFIAAVMSLAVMEEVHSFLIVIRQL